SSVGTFFGSRICPVAGFGANLISLIEGVEALQEGSELERIFSKIITNQQRIIELQKLQSLDKDILILQQQIQVRKLENQLLELKNQQLQQTIQKLNQETQAQKKAEARLIVELQKAKQELEELQQGK
ncbi:MAG: hypothetical protein ACRDFB_02620, partial [Rhabdochlamydiaceae bacterium]